MFLCIYIFLMTSLTLFILPLWCIFIEGRLGWIMGKRKGENWFLFKFWNSSPKNNVAKQLEFVLNYTISQQYINESRRIMREGQSCKEMPTNKKIVYEEDRTTRKRGRKMTRSRWPYGGVSISLFAGVSSCLSLLDAIEKKKGTHGSFGFFLLMHVLGLILVGCWWS